MAMVSLRRALIGRPFATARAVHERLDKWVALPVFASDAVSSSAYATEEILLGLMLVGPAVLSASLWAALMIAVLLVVVTSSYRQTVLAYPTGGGAYIVGRENIGPGAAVAAGAALLIDYILTVAVSVAAGVAAITSAIPALHPHTVLLSLLAILIIALANLRGVRESGLLFAIPTYTFIISMLVTLGFGIYRSTQGVVAASSGLVAPQAYDLGPVTALTSISLYVFLRAFASGCAALTGIEAISNGVQAFRPPEGRNAAVTMTWMAGILLTLFLGITYLAYRFQIVPYVAGSGGAAETVVSQVAETVWGGKHGFYFVVQIATMAILVLAANTSFADFPRLSAILARDRLLPRQLANVGDRLVYNNGIILLAILSSALLVAFRGSVHGLIPLYAVGVFLSFTVSQSGMVVRWRRLRTEGWRIKAAVNLLGAVTTAVVLLIILMAKFMPPDETVLVPLPFNAPVIGHSIRAGAWIVAVLIPLLMLLFARINRHYESVRSQLTLNRFDPPAPPPHTIIVLVPSINRGICPALQYAKALGKDTRALHIEIDPTASPRLREEWEQWGLGIPLIILESPYRSLVDPLFRYLDQVQAERRHVVTVIIPEFVARKWWHRLLHNQSGFLLKLALLFRRDVVVTNVRYYLSE